MNKIIKYGLVIVKDGKFLINRKYGTKLFLMPGGKPEAGESIEECLVREIKEEHEGYLVKASVKFFGQFEDMAANEPDTIISMKVYIGEVQGILKPSSEIEEQRWFGREDSIEILFKIIKKQIFPMLLERGII